ncbi:glycosyltransferase family 39 protein [Solihabitans fulvus]|uniref:glycosyltransferase family 39 protein n=1 Tax=Solihabitans fulvus TaxID=1892852 RepID=UPI001661CE68|nr:glycosyltransferase family 39 protein [Solihabitans fulvus]
MSPRDQPRWARPALLLIAALAAVLYGWGIRTSPMHNYYAAAVRSMSISWKAFLFGGFDPAASITIDKTPGAFWLQALSARAFGYHDWTLALPQIIEAVLTVLVLYKVVRRWSGPSAGLIAALAMALTPIAAALARSEIVDTLLTLLLVLAASTWQSAVGTGRLRTLLLAGVWVGLAVQVKMLQAWAVLPAFAVVYLIAAPGPLRRRLGHLAAAGGVTVVMSSLWAAIVLVTPTADRPYIDATTDNNPVGMIAGYNALSRFDSTGDATSALGSFGMHRGGPQGQPGQQDQPSARRGQGGTDRAGAPDGPSGYGGFGDQSTSKWATMFSDRMAPQVGWLFPLALLAMVFGVLWRRGRPRTDLLRAGFLMWGLWLLVHAVAFSVGQVNHSYYVVVLGPAVAALSGGGLVMFWRAYREHGPRAWVLPASILATVAWSVSLTLRFPTFLPWVVPVAVVLTLVALGALLFANSTGRNGSRLAVLGVLTGILAVLVTPGAWALSTDLPGQSGNNTGPAAGPTPGRQQQFAGQGRPRQEDGALTAQDVALLDFLRTGSGGAKYLAAVSGSNSASRYIIGAGVSMLPMGGFTGQTPFPNQAQFADLIRSGQLRYVLTGGFGGFGRGGSSDTEAARNLDWATTHCALVPPSSYGGRESAPTSSRSQQQQQKLYDCAGRA